MAYNNAQQLPQRSKPGLNPILPNFFDARPSNQAANTVLVAQYDDGLPVYRPNELNVAVSKFPWLRFVILEAC